MTERPICLTYENGDRICGPASVEPDGVTMTVRIERVEVARPFTALSPADLAAMTVLIAQGVTVAFTVGQPPKVVC